MSSTAPSVGLPGKIATFVDKNGDTLQNMALLAYLKKGEEAKPFLETVTTAKVSLSKVNGEILCVNNRE